MISTDQTGRFPITSGRGNTHIMVLYDHDSNFINAIAIKSRNTIDLIDGYDSLYKELYNAGIRPLIQGLDNEASKDLIAAIKDKELHFQLAPAGKHRTLPAEREQYKHSKTILLQDYMELMTDFQPINGID